jgi:hypothetical protein
MKNKKTFKEAYGRNPWDPWSAKAGLAETTEAQLEKYLLSRGINPKYVTKDVKIAHSKSNQFKQWASTHQEEVEQVDEASTTQLHRYLMSRGINPLYVSKDSKIAHSKSNQFKQWAATQNEEVQNEDHVAIAMGKQLDDEGSMVLNQLDILDDAIAKLRTAVKDPKMQIPAWVQSKITLAADYMDTVGHYMSSKNEDGMNEEVELEGSVQDTLHQRQQALRKKSGLPHPDYYKELGKSYDIEDDKERLSKQSEIKKKYNVESVLYDNPKGTLTRVTERKKELTRSARIIKSLYKKKGIKEDTYDWEKDDKDTSSYGKQPKFTKSDDKASKVKKESDAAAILSGGTTLTKQNRDIVELDPKMKMRPNKDAQDANDNDKNQ